MVDFHIHHKEFFFSFLISRLLIFKIEHPPSRDVVSLEKVICSADGLMSHDQYNIWLLFLGSGPEGDDVL